MLDTIPRKQRSPISDLGLHTRGALLTAIVLAVGLTGPSAAAAVVCAENRTEAVATNRLRTTWFDRLGELTGIARTLASSYDTSDFIMRPNIPYVYTHFDRKTLAAERIDVALIVDRRGKPLFGDARSRVPIAAFLMRGLSRRRCRRCRLPPQLASRA